MTPAQGDLAAALQSYRAALAIAERVAKADPGNAGWQRDVASGYGRVAMVLARQGSVSEAAAGFQMGRCHILQGMNFDLYPGEVITLLGRVGG